MRVPNLGETELLVPLHEGMFEQPMWLTFLERLRAVTGGDCAMVLFRPPGSEAIIQIASGQESVTPDLRDIYKHRFSLPADHGASTMREARVYALGELLDTADAQERPIFRRELQARDLRHMRCVRVSGDSGLDAWLVLIAHNPLGVAVASTLAALVPHMRVALQVLARLERERLRATTTEHAFSHINIGWITIDAACKIIDHDEEAERFLAQSGALRRGPYGRLYASLPAIDRQLTSIAKQFANDPAARPRAINLSQDSWIDLLVAPVRGESLLEDSQAVAVIYFRRDENSSSDRRQQLADAFDLTDSEARFAWSIAQGLSIKDAAQAHGLTLETGRHYSKRIYSKTGASGQVDLMRRVLTSVVAL